MWLVSVTRSQVWINLVLSLSLSHTGHWKFNMAPHGKELSEDLKKNIVAQHKDGVGYKKIDKTLKLSCSTVAKTIQRFNRTGSTQNRPRYGQPKKSSARVWEIDVWVLPALLNKLLEIPSQHLWCDFKCRPWAKNSSPNTNDLYICDTVISKLLQQRWKYNF